MRNIKSVQNIKARVCYLFAALCVILAGCQTVQEDIVLSQADEKARLDLGEIEKIVVTLDGQDADRESLATARQRIDELTGTVADAHYEAVLAAWSGRLYLMEGKAADARREYTKSQNLSPLNLPSQILSFRMERDPLRRLALIDSRLEAEDRPGELLAERGRVLFGMNRFAESVAAFDAAFAALETKPYYAEAYGVFRSRAWELRELREDSGSRTMEIAGQGLITWKDLIEITAAETRLFRFITAGREWPAESLFRELLDRAFIPDTQDAAAIEWPYARPASTETVLRSGAAWFLWHLYAETRADRGLLTRYSSRYASSRNSHSPIPDIAISSPFLDSVLGCVESEFMSLPDGRNFLPDETVKGAEFLATVRKLER